MHDPSFQYEGAPLREWRPNFPPGEVAKLYLHWSAGDYATVFPAYHFCVTLDPLAGPSVVATHDILENMRDVRENPELPYAAHTRGRNSHALGLSIMCMKDARPSDFGRFPLTPELIDALCFATARVAQFYRVPILASHVMTHAEAAVEDGYFGAGDDQRWDIARLAPSEEPLVPADAARVGDILREKIRAFSPSNAPLGGPAAGSME